jgi:hypothetical protein
MSKKKKTRREKTPAPAPKESSALLCALVSETEPLAMAHVDACFLCGKAVWRSLSSPKTPRAICRLCLLMRVQFTGDEKIVVMAPTKEQRADIKQYFEREK